VDLVNINAEEVDKLISQLLHEESMMRENAAYILGETSLEAIALTGDTLKSETDLARINAMTDANKRRQVVKALSSALQDKDPWVRGNAADALGKIGDPSSAIVLSDLLNDADKVVRYSAVEALGRIGADGVIEFLIKALSDEDWSVRLSAAKSLKSHPDKRAESALKQTAKDQNHDVRDFSIAALAQLS
jgi:HEAT repeat protein